jgi:hypothetical protein
MTDERRMIIVLTVSFVIVMVCFLGAAVTGS